MGKKQHDGDDDDDVCLCVCVCVLNDLETLAP